MEFSVTVVGLEGVKKLYNQVAKQSPVAQKNINHRLAMRTKELAKRNIHSATGETANKIVVRTGQNFAEVRAEAPWSLYVEEGFDMGGKLMPSTPRTRSYAGLYGFNSFRTFANAVTARGRHQGQHFMGKAVRQIQTEAKGIIEQEWSKLFTSKIGGF